MRFVSRPQCTLGHEKRALRRPGHRIKGKPQGAENIAANRPFSHSRDSGRHSSSPRPFGLQPSTECFNKIKKKGAVKNLTLVWCVVACVLSVPFLSSIVP